MIEWLERVQAGRPFLRADGRVWTYGETLAVVGSRRNDRPKLVQPSLSPDSVFDILAGILGGGATVLGPDPEASEPAEADLVVFTSGTTGPAKGVRLTRLNLTAAAAASADHLGHGPEDDWLLAMPLHHVGGLSILVRQIFTGGSVTLLPEFDPNRFARALRAPVTMASVVPTMLARLIDRGPYRGLRAVLVGGGPVPPGLLEKAADVGLPVLPTYGMTESFGQVATLRPGDPLEHKVRPLPGIEVRTDSDGRIAIKGPQVSPGYAGRPDRKDPWFVTRDLGEIDEEGALRILGRADSVIITGGEKVSPERVEAVLRRHPAVGEAVVLGLPDEEWGQRIVCVYEGPPARLEQWATDRLPSFMVPKGWTAVESIPRTSIGKPDRIAVRALVEELVDGGAEGEVEEQPETH